MRNATWMLALLVVTPLHLATAQTSVSVSLSPVSREPAVRRVPQPATVPTVLARSVLGSIFGMGDDDEPQFTVGRGPADWPAALRPGAGARIIGGVAMRGVRQVVLRYPRSTDGIADYSRILRQAGYRSPDALPGPAREGFGNRMFGPFPTEGVFCGDSSQAVIIRPIDSTSAERRIIVGMLPRAMSVSLCSPDRPQMSSPGLMMALRVPALEAPRGAAVQARGRSSSGNSFDIHAAADTALSAERLVTHYAAELARAGWTVVGRPAAAGGAALVALSARDTTGAQWQGALGVHTAGARRELHLRMSQSVEP